MDGADTIWIQDPANSYEITGTTTIYRVYVGGKPGSEIGTFNITLDNAHISGVSTGSPIQIHDDCTVNLTITNDNTMQAVGKHAGIGAGETTTLVISGTGKLSAACEYSVSVIGGTGIGGSSDPQGGYGINGGAITINSGTIIASGGRFGAGIGGGYNASAGTVTINGGTVTATGYAGSAGLGGFNSNSYKGGTIAINGGTVTATAGIGSPGIGYVDSLNITGGTVTAIGDNASALVSDSIQLPAAYLWWHNTTAIDPGGEGNAFPGTAFIDDYTYQFVKFVAVTPPSDDYDPPAPTLTPQSSTYPGFGGFAFTSNGSFSRFSSFSANGATLTKGVDYAVERMSGGTRITMTEAAMRALSGQVNFLAVFTEGAAGCKVLVNGIATPPNQVVDPPKTGDASGGYFFLGISAVIVALVVSRRKKRS